MFAQWKAARIAHAVERDISLRMHPPDLQHYRAQYAWGTEFGNRVFDAIARRSEKERLSEADAYALSLLSMLGQANHDGDDGGARIFADILRDVLPNLTSRISAGVLSELRFKLNAPENPNGSRQTEGSVQEAEENERLSVEVAMAPHQPENVFPGGQTVGNEVPTNRNLGRLREAIAAGEDREISESLTDCGYDVYQSSGLWQVSNRSGKSKYAQELRDLAMKVVEGTF